MAHLGPAKQITLAKQPVYPSHPDCLKKKQPAGPGMG
jgi:hypothetical protein